MKILNLTSLSLEATKPIPVTSFKCSEPGYYGDIETGCTVSVDFSKVLYVGMFN